jgi:hypothetical protein
MFEQCIGSSCKMLSGLSNLGRRGKYLLFCGDSVILDYRLNLKQRRFLF